MVRYMSYKGCRAKFDVQAYIDRVKREMKKPTNKRPKQAQKAGIAFRDNERGKASVPARLRHLDRTQRYAVLATYLPRSACQPYRLRAGEGREGHCLCHAIGHEKAPNMMRDRRSRS